MQKNKDRPIQKALALDQLKPEKSRQGNPSAMSPGNPEPSASNRSSRHSLSQACGNLPTTAREELAKRVNQSGSVRTIPTLDGRILLDWELYNIALDLGLPVRLEEFQGHDPVAFVVVHHLRHPRWDHGQRAVIAVRLHAWREPGRPGKTGTQYRFIIMPGWIQCDTGSPGNHGGDGRGRPGQPHLHHPGQAGARTRPVRGRHIRRPEVRRSVPTGQAGARRPDWRTPSGRARRNSRPPANEHRSSPTPDCSNGSRPTNSTSMTPGGWPGPERPEKGHRRGHVRSPRQN